MLEKLELWDLYNENREIIGEHIRGEVLLENTFHLVVHVWIKNSQGKYLISQRSKKRSKHPLKWECVGGAVLKGENSLQGALREVKEEVGIDLTNCKGKMLFSKIRTKVKNSKSKNYKIFNNILDVWLFEYEGNVSLENATTDEVTQVKWLDINEIKTLYNNGELVESLYYFFDEVAGN